MRLGARLFRICNSRLVAAQPIVKAYDSIFAMNRRAFLRTALGASAIGAVAASSVAYGADTHDLEVTHVPIRLGLPTPLRMVALGDIHFDPLYELDYLAQVGSAINRLRPDLIIYTGDLVTSRLERVTDLADLLAGVTAPLGAYCIAGNHELWTNVVYVGRVLEERAGIRMLRNVSIPLPGAEGFFLTGLDSFSAGNPDSTILDRTPVNSRHIVLAHEPDSFLSLNDPRIGLQISGHTHGGQVRLPWIGAVVLPSWGRDFQAGLYAREGRQLYVNRGIGTLPPHVRINCRPEITLLELT
jgi:predicted MPP superfamily phosphohydrolase